MRCLCNLKIYKLDSLIFRREINLRKVINLNYQINKIYKELKELPYGYGAAIGYSMIMDDIKTVDDAINEATIDMRNKKENNNG